VKESNESLDFGITRQHLVDLVIEDDDRKESVLRVIDLLMRLNGDCFQDPQEYSVLRRMKRRRDSVSP
jgi:hypothetical protein